MGSVVGGGGGGGGPRSRTAIRAAHAPGDPAAPFTLAPSRPPRSGEQEQMQRPTHLTTKRSCSTLSRSSTTDVTTGSSTARMAADPSGPAARPNADCSAAGRGRHLLRCEGRGERGAEAEGNRRQGSNEFRVGQRSWKSAALLTPRCPQGALQTESGCHSRRRWSQGASSQPGAREAGWLKVPAAQSVHPAAVQPASQRQRNQLAQRQHSRARSPAKEGSTQETNAAGGGGAGPGGASMCASCSRRRTAPDRKPPMSALSTSVTRDSCDSSTPASRTYLLIRGDTVKPAACAAGEARARGLNKTGKRGGQGPMGRRPGWRLVPTPPAGSRDDVCSQKACTNRHGEVCGELGRA